MESPSVESEAPQPQPYPFAKLANAFEVDDADLIMATCEEIGSIELEVNCCSWVDKWIALPLSAAIKNSPSKSFRDKMRRLLTSDSKIIGTFGLIIRYALIRLRLWSMNVELKDYSAPLCSYYVRAESIDAWIGEFELQGYKEGHYALPPACRSKEFKEDVSFRDSTTCLFSDWCLGPNYTVATHLAAYSWRPRNKNIPDNDPNFQSCKIIAMFLTAFLGKKLYKRVHQLLSTDSLENGISLGLSINKIFNRAAFVLDPMLETIQRDPETGEIITYLVCYRPYEPRSVHGRMLSNNGYSEGEPIEGPEAVYNIFYGEADCGLIPDNVAHLAPGIKIRIYRRNKLATHYPLPHPGLMVLQACIARLIINAGIPLPLDDSAFGDSGYPEDDRDKEYRYSYYDDFPDISNSAFDRIMDQLQNSSSSSQDLANEVNRLCYYKMDV
ncbi:hypothetical protein F5884DRAFT_804788 [Xylogone sp. PMI_703]|nr:hypothetical protein F5884DRAFT_804788 [Xylogone sp. PMI_703]